MEIFTIITSIGGVCGAIVTIIGFFTLIAKRPKNWIKKIAEDVHNDNMSSIVESLQKIEKGLELNDQSTLCILRHSITNLYYKYKDKKSIPTFAKQDWIRMYDRYIALGGNSYIKTITEVMENEWEEE